MAVRITCTDNASGHDGLRWSVREPGGEFVVVGETQPNETELILSSPPLPEACFVVAAYSGSEQAVSDEVCAATSSDPFAGAQPGDYIEEEGGYFVDVMYTQANGGGDRYALITAPRDGGHPSSMQWQAAIDWADALVLNGKSDWVIPTLDERTVEYWRLKPGASDNYTDHGAVDKTQPPLPNYSLNDPGQVQVADFQSAVVEGFSADGYWTSSEVTPGGNGWSVQFTDGRRSAVSKFSSIRVRAVRRAYF